MASISQDKRTRRWFCFFRFGDRAFNKSTNTTNERQADQIRVKVEENLDLLKRGKLELPPGADLWHWLISDGKRTGPISLVEPPAPSVDGTDARPTRLVPGIDELIPARYTGHHDRSHPHLVRHRTRGLARRRGTAAAGL